MAAVTAFRHQGMIGVNRPNGGLVMLTMEEVAAIMALVSPGTVAGEAAQSHLAAHRTMLGSRHSDYFDKIG